MPEASPRASVLQQYLRDHIPISQALGVQVVDSAPWGVRLAAPFAPNVNHRRSVFGGSIYSVAVLAGWSLVHERQRRLGLSDRVVIQRSEVEYLAPAEHDIEAICPSPPELEWQRFDRVRARKGRARLKVGVEVRADGHIVALMRGVYVSVAPAEAAR